MCSEKPWRQLLDVFLSAGGVWAGSHSGCFHADETSGGESNDKTCSFRSIKLNGVHFQPESSHSHKASWRWFASSVPSHHDAIMDNPGRGWSQSCSCRLAAVRRVQDSPLSFGMFSYYISSVRKWFGKNVKEKAKRYVEEIGLQLYHSFISRNRRGIAREKHPRDVDNWWAPGIRKLNVFEAFAAQPSILK